MNCPVCDQPMQPAAQDWLVQCPSCAFLKSTLPPGAGTGIDGIEALRRENFERLFGYLEELGSLSGKSVLEVGCSSGLFLEAARKRGIAITGLEPEKEKADTARAKGFTIIDGFFPDSLATDQLFDVIVFNDVFEHLPDPLAALKACDRHLGPDGLLILNLPDSGGILYRIASFLARAGFSGPFERLWQKGLPSPHVSYFNARNLQRLVEQKAGFRLLRTEHLKTVTLRGMKARIKVSYADPAASILYAGLLPFVALQSVLPADITVQFYRKGAGQ